MPVMKYDLNEAYRSGREDHPQKVMQSLGYNVLRFEGVPMADCVFIEVDSLIDPLPKFLTISEFQFSLNDL